MAKTVKEIANKVLNMSNLLTYSPEDLKEFTKDILQAHENEIAEKDEEIEYLKNEIDSHKLGYKLLKINYDDLESKQLFKEDFIYLKICEICREYEDKCKNGTYPPNHKEYYKKYFVLIDNLKYDKLPSKDKDVK